MNTKILIGAIVGGLIVFIWQTMSWTFLNLHGSESTYTPKQDSVLAYLSTQFTEDGAYQMPMPSPTSTSEEKQKMMTDMTGKPWAKVTYYKSWKMNMGMNMFRGLLVDVVAVWLLLWLLMKIPNVSLQTAVISSVAVGVIGYLTTEYTYSIWYGGNTIPDLIDALISWSLCGVWLGFFINRK